jgi:hypothetical protein
MRALIVILIALLAAGCSRSATIHMKGGGIVRGEIARSDAASIYVKAESSGEERAVSRANIHEIDHPGDILGVIGTILAVPSMVLAIVGVAFYCEAPPSVGETVGTVSIVTGLVIGIPSIVVAIGGFSRYSESADAARLDLDKPRIAPSVMSDGTRTYWGLGMSWSW